MFSIFRSKKSATNAFDFLHTDMHSHLLPGVDDGAENAEDSFELINGLHELGFKKLITTPHIYTDFYKNSRTTLQPAFEKIKEKEGIRYPEVEFQYSAEYFLDTFFEEKVKNKELIPFGENHVLIEISFVGYSPILEETVFELVMQGYKPILAHPERYTYLAKSFQKFRKLRELGCELQLNINSLGGYYGKASEEMAHRLMEEKLVSYLGTDMHHLRHLDFMKKMGSNKRLMKELRSYDWKNGEL
ncbi:tyrosine-protein phosphatase [Jiulongibacter sp. NS-SX5]|uniref:tyrosine-protein phosphatase n=1 Tax=Jiulongibacter sp. NS-SX5 TaxID=3463854 RepID=UPI004058F35A